MIFVSLYVASVVVVNAMFILLPPFQIGGVFLTAGSIVCGSTFVLRDLADRRVGNKVLIATLAATAITAAMSAQLAVASGLAFLLSELIDMAVFRKWPGSFKARVVASSIIGTPIDSAVFMLLAGFFSWAGLAVMVTSKLVALACIRWIR